MIKPYAWLLVVTTKSVEGDSSFTLTELWFSLTVLSQRIAELRTMYNVDVVEEIPIFRGPTPLVNALGSLHRAFNETIGPEPPEGHDWKVDVRAVQALASKYEMASEDLNAC